MPKISALYVVLTVACISSAQAGVDTAKVLNVAFEAPDDGFDMVKTYNYYSAKIAEVIFEPPLTYDYLARPVQLIPNTLEAMPIIEQNGKVYILKLKKGIYFAPDPAFKGKKRELTAQDYRYAIQRILDPINRSPAYAFLRGKILGVDAAVAQAQKTGQFDYVAPIAGLTVLDPYTLKITLTRPDYNFQYILAYISLGAVAKEVVDYYGPRIAQHPVGTGPYQLSRYMPRTKIELVANPYYRGFTWQYKSTGSTWDNQLVHTMTGKPMPQIGKVNVSIIEEDQSRWLALKTGQLDFDMLPSNAIPQVLDGNQLKPSFVKQGVQLYRNQDPEVTYTTFNMKNPIVGGFSLDKIALRRAISLSYNNAEEIRQLYKGQAVKNEMFIPDGVQGSDPDYKSSIGYNPLLANKLLDYYGYKKGADGYRTLPNGQPLTLVMMTENSSRSVIKAELWKKSLDAIAIKIDFKVSNFADNMKAAVQCQYMMWSGAWIADYPEGENFMQLLYGSNAGQGNFSCYQSKVFDNLYQQAMAVPAQQRQAFYHKMSRQIEADNPLVIHASRIRNWYIAPKVQGFKAHPMLGSVWPYLDLKNSSK